MKQEFSEVIKSTSLLRLDLQSASCNLNVPPAAVEPPNVQLNIYREVKWQLSEKKDALICFVGNEVRGMPKKEEGQIEQEASPLFEMKSVFAVIYRLSSTNLSEKELAWFAENNASFNVHPFAREFFDSLSRKMGIAPVTLPLLKPETKTLTNKH